MKKYLNLKVLLALAIAAIAMSCDLDLQESFDLRDDVDTTDPFANMTAWEFIQSDTIPNEDSTLRNEGLNFMAAAIRKAGLISLYDQEATTNRTYIMIANFAFTRGVNNAQGTRAVLEIGAFNAANETAAEYIDRVIDTPEKMNRLRAVLRYHIVSDFVAQLPTLSEAGRIFEFNTLLPDSPEIVGDESEIIFSRDFELRITVNQEEGSPLPPESFEGGWSRVMTHHNFVFNNGIGHLSRVLVRNQPYALNDERTDLAVPTP